MGGICSMHVNEERCVQNWPEHLKERGKPCSSWGNFKIDVKVVVWVFARGIRLVENRIQ
jgi:hypothetical protein